MERVRCRTPRCRRAAKSKSKWCPRCAARIWAKEHPLTYAYNKLRSNAKRRGHGFTLTLEEFAKVCEETGYLKAKGRMRECLSIDRIDSGKGYSADNIRVITVSMNARLRNAPLPGWMREMMEKELSGQMHVMYDVPKT